MDSKIKFEVELSPGQLEKLEEWTNAHKLIFGRYGKFSYHFFPSEIDTYLEITSDLSKQTISFVV
jgi:hypothetical protein